VIAMVRNSTRSKGQEGENIAFSYLRQRGYHVMDRNYRCPCGEIDLIAKDGETLVFVEVKTRHSTIFGQPEEAVDFKKRKKMSAVALWYIEEKKINNYYARFDVVSILLSKDPPEIQLFRDAFDFV
jgi:putative endonuclease